MNSLLGRLFTGMLLFHGWIDQHYSLPNDEGHVAYSIPFLLFRLVSWGNGVNSGSFSIYAKVKGRASSDLIIDCRLNSDVDCCHEDIDNSRQVILSYDWVSMIPECNVYKSRFRSTRRADKRYKRHPTPPNCHRQIPRLVRICVSLRLQRAR